MNRRTVNGRTARSQWGLDPLSLGLIAIGILFAVAGLRLVLESLGGLLLLVLVLVAGGLALQATSHWRAASDGLGTFLRLSPDDFERAIGDLLTRHGYQHLRRTGGSGDLAADLIGHNERGEYVVVQCKRYDPGRRVGSAEIQLFIGMITVAHRADRGVYVTTSSFTAPAAALAAAHGVTLINGDLLTALTA